MDKLQPLPLFGLGFSSKSKVVTSQLLTNLYREPQSDQDKTAMAIYGTAGATQVGDLGASPARGAIQNGNFIYAVHGNTLYSINNAWVYTALGVLNTSNGRLDMEVNGFQLMIVDGVNGYIYTFATGVFVQIADADFANGAKTVTFLAGYFVVDDPASPGRFRWCASYNGLAWDQTDFATAEFNPDPLVAVRSEAGYLYLCGYVTTEIWAPSGDTRVFARVGGAGLEYGIAGPWAITKFKNSSLMMLGHSILGQTQVLQLIGVNVREIPGPETTNSINQQVTGSASANSYSLDNHGFFQLNFAGVSYLYDDMSNSWSEVSTASGRHYAEIRVEMFSVSYASDYASGKWYKADPNAYVDGPSPLIRELITRHVFAGGNEVSVDELFIDMEVGVGLNSGQGANPVLMLSWSKDGGRVYGNEIMLPMGAIGQYRGRVSCTNLGSSRDWVFKMRVSDPVKVVFVGASARLS